MSSSETAVTVATWIVGALAVYAGIGIVFAIPFVAVGAGRIDGAASNGTVGFRILILPGAAALWPLLLVRWMRGDGKPPEEHTPHRAAAPRAPKRASVRPTTRPAPRARARASAAAEGGPDPAAEEPAEGRDPESRAAEEPAPEGDVRPEGAPPEDAKEVPS